MPSDIPPVVLVFGVDAALRYEPRARLEVAGMDVLEMEASRVVFAC
jgi:hypothetical protein